MLHMDTTQPPDAGVPNPAPQSPTPQGAEAIEALAAVDPAAAPELAETLATELSAEHERTEADREVEA